MKPEFIDIAKERAAAYGIDPALVCAVIEQESGWDPWAVRFEPAFLDRYLARMVLSPTEKTARAFSYGFMQVMGQVARESGFDDHFLTKLCDPFVGIDVGCRVLKIKLARAAGDVEKGLLLWNGGGNQNYPREVIARIDKYK